uniref:tRNA (guanine(37)-N1)-methyltransferase n=1 Tax=Rhabditophanes sp. KR3021 TaxID=114890 RepID=A0AC35TK67_9BILA
MANPFIIPECVRGSTQLDKDKFKTTVSIPFVKVPANMVGRLVGAAALKELTIPTLNRIRPIVNGDSKTERLMLFNPLLITETSIPIIKDTIKNICDTEVTLDYKKFELTYEDFDIKRVMKALLPDDLDFSGFTQIGHIAHCNLREELYPYKHLIGQIIMDKTKWCKTVVNKIDSINNEFRFFEMELLAGKEDYVAEVIEDKNRYQMDFSKVFWNSRLGNEHKRLISKLDHNSIVFDGFAGVGPFVIPAAKKGVRKIFGNDLNPESVKWMQKNVKINRLEGDLIELSNLDAAEFFKTSMRNYLLTCKGSTDINCHVIMNLPAIAVTFLPALKSLLHGQDQSDFQFPIFVHCYLFAKSSVDVPSTWFGEESQRLVKQNIGIDGLDFLEVYNVRNVAGRKEMYCCSFQLPADYIFANECKKRTLDNNDCVEIDAKILKTSV